MKESTKALLLLIPAKVHDLFIIPGVSSAQSSVVKAKELDFHVAEISNRLFQLICRPVRAIMFSAVCRLTEYARCRCLIKMDVEINKKLGGF